MNKKDIGIFEANFLDGDSIDDCGKATFSVSGVIDVVDFFQNKQKEDILEMIGDKLDELMINPGEEDQIALDILENFLEELNK